MTASVTQLIPRQGAQPRDDLPYDLVSYDAVLSPRGALGFAASARLRALLEDLAGVGYDRVVVDLEQVPEVDRSTVAILSSARRRLAREGTQMVLRRATGPAEQVLRASSLCGLVES